MANVKVTLKDGSVKEVAAGTTLLEVAKGLSQKLGKQALLAVVDGVNKDLTDKLEHDASVEFVVPESSEGLHAIRIPRHISWPRQFSTCSPILNLLSDLLLLMVFIMI